ncbi:reverse transcriptase domain-containing protein [Tanacetum coccineum]
MPFGLKNARATYQRLVDTIFEGQIGRNLEAYVDDMVIKSKRKPEMIKDVEETLLTLKKVNMKLNPKKCSFGIEEGKFLGYQVTSEGIRANTKKQRFLSKAAEKALPCLDTLKKCTNKKDFRWTTEAEEVFQEIKRLITELPTLTAPKKGEELMVYLSAANEAVDAILLVERQGRQAPIHYLIRTLQGAEINYPIIEKLVLALVHAARRLRRSAIKGQVLADFLADTMVEESSTLVKASGLNDTLTKGKSKEEQEAPKTKTPKNLGTKTDIWKLYTDGASNEHGPESGLIRIDPEGAEYSYALRLNFANSNNDVEYEALLASLRIVAKMKVKKMHAFVDLKLVASQVEGSYEAKIDALSKLAAVQCEGLTKGVLIEELNEQSVDMVEVKQSLKKQQELR